MTKHYRNHNIRFNMTDEGGVQAWERLHSAEVEQDLSLIHISFVIRAVQPVLEKMDNTYEEAAYMLGATPYKTFFKVILPELRPALLTGFGLAFARGIGEYGSVIYISGNSACLLYTSRGVFKACQGR